MQGGLPCGYTIESYSVAEARQAVPAGTDDRNDDDDDDYDCAMTILRIMSAILVVTMIGFTLVR